MAELEIEDESGDVLSFVSEGSKIGVTMEGPWVDISPRQALRTIKFLSDWLIDQ